MQESKYGVHVNGILLDTTRQERGFTIEQLAEEAGLAPKTIHSWIWGKRRAQRDKFFQVCRVLDVPPGVLLFSAEELVEHGRTKRVTRFHLKEVLGTNEPPTYKEIQLIEGDLISEQEREAEEDEVREEDFTISSEDTSHSDTEPDAPEGDEVP